MILYLESINTVRIRKLINYGTEVNIEEKS
jgi:hypothetical protein